MNTTDTLKLAAEFDKRFTSMNGVDVPERVNVPRDEWRALHTAIKQALAAPTVQEPVGWKLVPIEPTNEMIDAGNDVEDLYRRGTPETWGKVYRAMIRVAPAAQTASEYVKTYHGGKPWPLQPAPEKGQP